MAVTYNDKYDITINQIVIIVTFQLHNKHLFNFVTAITMIKLIITATVLKLVLVAIRLFYASQVSEPPNYFHK